MERASSAEAPSRASWHTKPLSRHTCRGADGQRHWHNGTPNHSVDTSNQHACRWTMARVPFSALFLRVSLTLCASQRCMPLTVCLTALPSLTVCLTVPLAVCLPVPLLCAPPALCLPVPLALTCCRKESSRSCWTAGVGPELGGELRGTSTWQWVSTWQWASIWHGSGHQQRAIAQHSTESSSITAQHHSTTQQQHDSTASRSTAA